METATEPTVLPTSPRRARVARVVIALLASLALASTSLALFTRHNDFPVSYHPDEGSKVNQIGSPTGKRNFNHPLLLIESADLARQVCNVSADDERALAIAGRWTSAVLASIGVFAFALLGYAARGWIGLLIVGPTLALCPPLLVYAHYFKEDASLIGSLAVAALGAVLVAATRRPVAQLAATLVLAVGVAMAASGKYVGAAAAVPALVALLIAPFAWWWQVPTRILLVALVAVAATVAINARAFEDPWHLQLKPAATESFEGEFEHGTNGHNGIALPVPNAFSLRVVVGEMMPHLWAIATVGATLMTVAAMRRRRWPVSRVGIVVAAFPLTFAAVLARNTIPFERYALPITVFAYVAAATLASAGIASIPRPRVRHIAVAVMCLTIVLAQGQRCLDFNGRFADDSRQRLREWLATNVPPGTIIAADRFADLSSAGDPWRFPNQAEPRLAIVNAGDVATAGRDLHQLRRRRVRYVVVARPSFGRYFAEGIRTVLGDGAWLARVQRFYRELFEQGVLVWSHVPDPSANGYVDPEIRVYDIATTTPTSPTLPSMR